MGGLPLFNISHGSNNPMRESVKNTQTWKSNPGHLGRRRMCYPLSSLYIGLSYSDFSGNLACNINFKNLDQASPRGCSVLSDCHYEASVTNAIPYSLSFQLLTTHG